MIAMDKVHYHGLYSYQPLLSIAQHLSKVSIIQLFHFSNSCTATNGTLNFFLAGFFYSLVISTKLKRKYFHGLFNQH